MHGVLQRGASGNVVTSGTCGTERMRRCITGARKHGNIVMQTSKAMVRKVISAIAVEMQRCTTGARRHGIIVMPTSKAMARKVISVTAVGTAGRPVVRWLHVSVRWLHVSGEEHRQTTHTRRADGKATDTTDGY